MSEFEMTVVDAVSVEIDRINQELDRLATTIRVADLEARDAIPTTSRYEGLWVEVLGESKVYRLTGGLNNGCWEERVGLSAIGVPLAAADQYGVVKIGSGIDVTSDGTIGVPTATDTIAGLVKGGGNVGVAEDGSMVIDRATTESAGIVELATRDEAQAGTPGALVITAELLADWASENGAIESLVGEVTTSGAWICPKSGWYKVVAVGGGGGGGSGGSSSAGGGGGGAYMKYVFLPQGQSINCVIGAGGAVNVAGGDTSIALPGGTITGRGGKAPTQASPYYGGVGGTGSGSGGYSSSGGQGANHVGAGASAGQPVLGVIYGGGGGGAGHATTYQEGARGGCGMFGVGGSSSSSFGSVPTKGSGTGGGNPGSVGGGGGGPGGGGGGGTGGTGGNGAAVFILLGVE